MGTYHQKCPCHCIREVSQITCHQALHPCLCTWDGCEHLPPGVASVFVSLHTWVECSGLRSGWFKSTLALTLRYSSPPSVLLGSGYHIRSRLSFSTAWATCSRALLGMRCCFSLSLKQGSVLESSTSCLNWPTAPHATMQVLARCVLDVHELLETVRYWGNCCVNADVWGSRGAQTQEVRLLRKLTPIRRHFTDVTL